MKTICFVVSAFPSVSETFVVNQIVAAKRNGLNIKVLTNKCLPISLSSQLKILEEHEILKDIISVNFDMPKNKMVRILKAFFYIICYFRFWIKLEKRYSFKQGISLLPYKLAYYCQFKFVDVFHIQFATVGNDVAEMKYAGLLNAKVVTTLHGYDVHFENQTQLSRLKERYKLLFDVSDFITANTAFLAEKAEQLFVKPYKLLLIPMGVDNTFFKLSVPKSINRASTIKLLSVGRLIPLKGHEFGVLVVKKLVDNGYNICYDIVGEGKEYLELKSLIDTLGLNDVIRLHGKQNQEFIKKCLDECHVFLMTSITDFTGRAEAQGLVLAEAQAMGMPVVAFNSGGVKYSIKSNETGILVSEKNIDAMVSSIKELIETPEKYGKMSIAAIKHVSNELSMVKMGARFLALYES
ncbi:glycosyltransferase [Aestuariibaculum sediminum]|uniref:Glycosyltransferase n=1 Tax=Aestuariibaculum sediminum TaxID=2770637 RepID=A0A8J6Q354_9FLAO|nr:glycosyltransferase [Aestuariibaculum sediminum]MBD0833089.1 glycosyltransferase [Aestuariibaculum sediminum]